MKNSLINLFRYFGHRKEINNSTARCFSSSGGDGKKPKTGIFMLNMGGPQNLDEVQPFLTRLFTDKDIINIPMQSFLGPRIAKRRSKGVRQKYSEIGGGSPILKWTELQGKLLCDYLDAKSPSTGPHKHYVGFRYTHPLTEDTLSQMEKDGLKQAIAFSQYPQYSCATTGSSINRIAQFYNEKFKGRNSAIKWKVIDRWPVNSGLIACWTRKISTQLSKLSQEVQKDIVLLFSAHSLPFSQVALGDPYPTEVGATVVRVMESLGIDNPYRLVWQSKVGPVTWLEPKTEETIINLAGRGRKNFMIIPISFVNEHIETLHELDIEYGSDLVKKLALNTLVRIETPNDCELFIEGMGQLVMQRLSAPEACSIQATFQCPGCRKDTCAEGKKWLQTIRAD